MKKRRILTFFFFCAAYFLCATHPAQAHKVNIFAYIDGNTVYTESYFSDGRAVTGGKIVVKDDAEQVLLEGTTDKQGLFTFPLPTNAGSLTIIIDAALGHKNSFILQLTAQE